MSPSKSSHKKSNVGKQLPTKTSWEIGSSDHPYFIVIHPHEIVLGEGLPPNDIGTSCSYAKFLAGEWQDHIRSYFGEQILQEVIQAVKLMPNTPEYQRFFDEDNHMLNYFKSIPLDESLAKFENNDNIEERGFSHYGYLKDFKSQSGIVLKSGTELKSDTVTLVYGLFKSLDGKSLPMYLAKGFLIDNKTQKERSIGVGLQPEEGIALHDIFYICDGQSFLVLNRDGKYLSQEWEMKLFGSRIRIERVWRIGEVVCFHYRWFHENHPKGVLVFDVQKGAFGKHWIFSD